MSYARAFFSRAFWRAYRRHGFSPSRTATAFLSVFGGLWLLIEATSFFSPTIADGFRHNWHFVLVIGLLVAAVQNRPCHRVGCRLAGRDVTIEVRVGNMFDLPGAFVIGSNASFDTDTRNGLISPVSVQGKFTSLFYDSVGHLDSDLAAALAVFPSQRAPGTKPGKPYVYPIGTTVRLVTRGRPAYLVAIAALNDYGVARATFDDLKTALPALWECVATKGGFERVVMPVLGSGFSRLPQTREEIIREIVKSFVAACSSSRPTESLTIVIPYKDFYEHQVDLRDLERFIQHICRYTEYRSPEATGTGRGVA